ncbi:MAG: hypothetical protein HOC93_08680 [Phycisphaerae bacterium]|jgi:hypothetical protein|nr:hypothetical protein [Phycisphaerae bacterium]
MEEYDEQQVSEAAWKFLRSNTTGTLRFGEHLHDVSYVFGNDGLMIITAMVAMLQPQDMVMYVPEYAEDCMEMHVTLEQFSEEGSGGVFADRWQMYHGEPPDIQWAKVTIDAARFHEMFIDGEGLHKENDFACDEPSLCKKLNGDIPKLITGCKRIAGIEVEAPVVVGVDPLGIDVRARFGIVRLAAELPFAKASDVITFMNQNG